MIRNFEKYTHEMTPGENARVMPWLIKNLTLALGKEKAITNKTLVDRFNQEQLKLYHDFMINKDDIVKTEAARMRKLIHILRVSDTLPLLLAGAKGYYISDNKEEIETYIASIEDRLRAIHSTRRALKRQLASSKEYQDGVQTKLVYDD